MALAASGLVAFNLCVIGAVGRAGPLLARQAPRPRMLAAAAVVVAGTAPAQGGGRASTAGLALAWLAVATPAAFVAWYSGLGRLGVDRAGRFAGLIPVA